MTLQMQNHYFKTRLDFNGSKDFYSVKQELSEFFASKRLTM